MGKAPDANAHKNNNNNYYSSIAKALVFLDKSKLGMCDSYETIVESVLYDAGYGNVQLISISDSELNKYHSKTEFKGSRKTAFSIEDFIAKLYRDNGSFKLRLLHVLGKIDAGTYTLAVKSMNKYMVRNKSRYEDDDEQFSTISADDAIRMACGIMNCNIRDIHITDLITSRHN